MDLEYIFSKIYIYLTAYLRIILWILKKIELYYIIWRYVEIQLHTNFFR